MSPFSNKTVQSTWKGLSYLKEMSNMATVGHIFSTKYVQTKLYCLCFEIQKGNLWHCTVYCISLFMNSEPSIIAENSKSASHTTPQILPPRVENHCKISTSRWQSAYHCYLKHFIPPLLTWHSFALIQYWILMKMDTVMNWYFWCIKMIYQWFSNKCWEPRSKCAESLDKTSNGEDLY